MPTLAASEHQPETAGAELEWHRGLQRARGMPAFAAAATAAAAALPGCREATLLWSLTWPGEREVFPHAALSAERLGLTDLAVCATTGAQRSRRGDDVAVALFVDQDGAAAVLLCRLEDASHDVPDSEPWQRFIEIASAHAAAQMEVAQLRDSLKRLEETEKLQRALFAIADMAGAELDMQEMLRGLHRIVAGLMYAENFYIALYDAGRDAVRFLYYVDIADEEPPNTDEYVPLQAIERGCTWYVIHDARPLMGPTHALRRQVSGPLRILGNRADDWMGVPMLRGSEVRGVLVVQSYSEGECFTAEDQALLAFVANHILTALERKQGKAELEARVEQRTRELELANRELAAEVEERQRANQLQSALYRIAELSAADGSYDEFFAAIHRIVAELLIADNFYIAVVSDDGAELSFPYFVDCSQPSPVSRPFGRSATEYVVRTARPLLADGSEMNRLHRTGDIVLRGTPAEYWLGVPLCGSAGVLGVVAVQSYDPAIRYGMREQELLTYVSHKIANSLERRRAAEALRAANAQLEQRVEARTRELRQQIAERERIELRLKHEVVHDALTGLPNRRYLRDRLERVLARLQRHPARGFAVLYLDVDRFKVINDSLGHAAGDAVLKEVAARLNRCVRAPDVVARLGGDEFAILLEDLGPHGTPVRVAQRILRALRQPIHVAGKELAGSASIGIAHGESRHSCADDVLRDADVAMYRAKSRGKQRYEMFDQALHREALDALELEQDLRHALVNDEFEPFLQPLVQLGDGSTIGYEALLRWRHPKRGLLAPGAFLQLAEDLGLIEAIDWIMYAKSCRAATRLADPDSFITINVSPRHFEHADFDRQLLEMIAASGLAPARLRIELTEGTLLANSEQVREILLRLQAAGVHAALDDFGTGYSSLGYLHRFPLQILKIDRSFITALDSEESGAGPACVRAILALAQSLGLQVIAEGIETAGQRDALVSLGCGLGQGYLFAYPQPAAHWLPEVLALD